MPQTDTSLSVSQVTRLIKDTLEGRLGTLWVAGEISNYIRHRSGHIYFTLKDSSSELKAAMFKGYNRYLRFEPENGMQVLVEGRISVYEPRGYYQLIARRLEAAGTGTLFLALEALKKKLSAEGLFDEDRKRPLPANPATIGIITSGSGAAVRDIIQVLQRRAPQVKLILRPTQVQGEGAAGDLVAALEELQEQGQSDLLIIGRGGGSLEDLWPFNEEAVARAIAACELPVISAVGHETDFTLADLVSDLRAPTPSAAAELAATPREELLARCEYYREKLELTIRRQVEDRSQQLDHLLERYAFQRPQLMLERSTERLSELEKTLLRIMKINLQQAGESLNNYQRQLAVLSPRGVLERGYALARRKADNQILRRPADIAVEGKFDLELARGSISAIRTDDQDASQDQ